AVLRWPHFARRARPDHRYGLRATARGTRALTLRSSGMRVLVTGGAGFIGSHVVDALVARGDDVIVLDDLASGRTGRLNPQATPHKGGITDAAGREAGGAGVWPGGVCPLGAPNAS